MQHEFRHVALGQLRVSATLAQIERRAHLDKGGIKELAESIGTVGILQPLVVRPYSTKDANTGEVRFEIVAGERRFLAALQAKLLTVPVNVLDLTDEQVLEVQLVENLQREDVHPMAEAEGYEGLRKLGRTVDEIADKVGKSKAYVYGRMKLLELVPVARKAFNDGRLNASTALYLARVPKGLQEQALKAITKEKWDGTLMGAREVQDLLQREFMMRLSEAPFDTKDADLMKAAGACTACPKRSGNNPGLFGDIERADVCSDTICFKQKVTAHLAVATEAARAKGIDVIPAHLVKKLAPNGLHNIKGYVRLEDSQYHGGKYQTNKQILGKGYKVSTVVVDERSGKLVEVAPIADMPKDKKASSSGGRSTSSSDSAKDKQSKEIELRTRQGIFRAAMAAAPAKVDRATLQDLVLQELEANIGPEEEFFETLGRESVKGGIEGLLKSLTEPELARLAAVATVASDATGSYGSASDLLAVAKRYGVDAKKIRAEVTTIVKAMAPVKAKAKKKAGKK